MVYLEGLTGECLFFLKKKKEEETKKKKTQKHILGL